MNAITAVISRIEQVVVRRAAHHFVEIDQAVEAGPGSARFVHLVWYLSLSLAPSGAVRVARNHRYAHDLDAPGPVPARHILNAGDDFVRTYFTANVIRAH